MDRRIIDITGEKFGRIFVLGLAYSGYGRSYWDCLCDCGTRKLIRSDALRKGITKSCGCLSREIATTHGHTPKSGMSPIYSSWLNMKRRCTEPNHVSWKNYGARGITVCDRWRVFENFLADMKDGWQTGSTLERINVNGNYCPENCRWATPKEQANNRRNNVILTLNGESHTVSEWEQLRGFKGTLISCRLHAGWSPEKAITAPPRPKKCQ